MYTNPFNRKHSTIRQMLDKLLDPTRKTIMRSESVCSAGSNSSKGSNGSLSRFSHGHRVLQWGRKWTAEGKTTFFLLVPSALWTDNKGKMMSAFRDTVVLETTCQSSVLMLRAKHRNNDRKSVSRKYGITETVSVEVIHYRPLMVRWSKDGTGWAIVHANRLWYLDFLRGQRR